MMTHVVALEKIGECSVRHSNTFMSKAGSSYHIKDSFIISSHGLADYIISYHII